MYDDVDLSVQTTQSDVTSPGLVSTTYYDPLGRVRLSTDGDGNSVATAYRYQSNSTSLELRSNPYSATADGTAGWTLTTLDPLGRVTEVAHYHGSTAPSVRGANTTGARTSTVQYEQTASGCTAPATTVTDEAGNTHTSQNGATNHRIAD